MTPPASTDRAGALRAAVRAVVAEQGLHGASMSRIARAAGVATGTAYVHYDDKDDLVLAAYAEAKHALGTAATDALAADSPAAPGADPPAAPGADPAAVFREMWLAAHHHLRDHPADAAFLVQIDASPLWEAAHDRVVAGGGDPLSAAVDASGMRDVLVDLPEPVLHELGLAPAIRLAARDLTLTEQQLERVAAGCWQAIT